MTKVEEMERRIAELESKLEAVTSNRAVKRPWHEVREFILADLDKLGIGDSGDKHKLYTGITTVIRYSLDVDRVNDISKDLVPQALELAEIITEEISKKREKLKAENIA